MLPVDCVIQFLVSGIQGRDIFGKKKHTLVEERRGEERRGEERRGEERRGEEGRGGERRGGERRGVE